MEPFPSINNATNMKTKTIITAFTIALTIISMPISHAADQPDTKKEAIKAKPYPLETCIVSDDKLGEMGKPVVFEYEGQEIKLCCKDCRDDFDKKPAKYLKKLKKDKEK